GLGGGSQRQTDSDRARPFAVVTDPNTEAGSRSPGGLALGLVPFLPFLVSAGEGFYRHAIVYNSLPDNWGIGFFLNASEQNARFAAAATRFAPIYRASARYLILLACTMLGAWGRWRRWSPYRIYFLCLATFLVFTPGFGVQYTVYVVPLLFAV